MKETMDVLIAYVIIIIGLSVLLQVIVEVAKNFLRLRWSVYEKFFVQLYRRYFNPTDSPEEIQQDSLISRILQFFQQINKRERVGSVTLRFRNFHNTIVSYAEEMEKLKTDLLRLRASIIDEKTAPSPDELIGLYKKLSRSKTKLKAIRLESLFRIYNRTFNVMEKEKTEKFNLSLGKIDQLLQEIQSISVSKESVKLIDTILEGINDIEDFIQDYKNRISSFFENWLRELEVRYTRYIAVWTFFIGLAMVSILNADSVRIYKTLKSDLTIRTSIIAQSEALTESITPPFITERINHISKMAEEIKTKIEKEKNLDRVKLSSLHTNLKSFIETVQEYISSFKISHNSETIKLPYDLTKESESLMKYLKEEKTSEEGLERLQNILDSILIKIAENYSALMIGLIKAKGKSLYEAPLPLGWDKTELSQLAEATNLLKKFLGLLVTTLLISFGAPFWNDILKTLFGLQGFLRKTATESPETEKPQ